MCTEFTFSELVEGCRLSDTENLEFVTDQMLILTEKVIKKAEATVGLCATQLLEFCCLSYEEW